MNLRLEKIMKKKEALPEPRGGGSSHLKTQSNKPACAYLSNYWCHKDRGNKIRVCGQVALELNECVGGAELCH